jgi:cytochrome bd-type quinol oxidase subunit 2
MERALNTLHILCAVVLIAAHAVFLFRGLAIEAGRRKPHKLDRLARSLSQALLPATVLSGLILTLADTASFSLLHLLLGLAPLAAIPLVFLARVLLKKRTQAPWFLPAINLILLVAAGVTGLSGWR